MLRKHLETQMASEIENGAPFVWSSVGGGSINNTYKATAENHRYFIKTNTRELFQNGFDEEVLGLEFLQKNSAMTPRIILNGTLDNHIYLILEWVESGSKTGEFWMNFANQLATLHKQTSDSFGLDHNNFMGQLEQQNDFYDNFSEFFIENRLKPQIKLAYNDGFLAKNHLMKFEGLFKTLESLLPVERPAAVHGDLWSGNYLCNQNEKAVLIDPAVYYGHREVDLAMSTLFGGFSEVFYRVYQEVFPMQPGFGERKDIYNLYPLLIHLNLFGSSYLGGIIRIINRF